MTYITKLLLFLVLLAGNAYALDECKEGAWWDIPGEGIILQHISDERTIGFLFTYGQDDHQRWYVMNFGENDSGNMYGTDKQGNEHTVGWASLDVIEQVEEGDEEMLLFMFNINHDPMKPPWCLSHACTGTWLVTRPAILGSCP